MNTGLELLQEYLKYHVGHCSGGVGKTVYGLSAVLIVYMNGLKDVEKDERFGNVGDTLNNENVATYVLAGDAAVPDGLVFMRRLNSIVISS